MLSLPDKEFAGYKIPQNGPYIKVNQNRAIEELEEIPVEQNTKEDLQRSPAMHTMYWYI